MPATAQNHVRDRRRQAYGAARAHSRTVSVLKIALPLVALGGLIWMSAGLFVGGNSAIPTVSIGDTTLRDGAVVMANPEMIGVTSDDRPYRIVAREAIQQTGENGRIDMTDIGADFAMPDGTEARLTAPQGTFDRAANNLTLAGPSLFTTADGVEVNFTSAAIDVDTGSFATDEAVTISQRGSVINAGSMHIHDNGARVVFERDVRMIIQPDALPKSASGGRQSVSGTTPTE